jgi:LacI family transcriptional regulator
MRLAMKKEENHGPAGIKEIARLLGISIGTVDRALHARPGISPETRAKVLKTAEQLNYRPNVAARSLKLNRRLHIAVHLPKQITSFFDPLREGIRAAAAASSGVAIDLEFRTYPYIGKGDIELLEAVIGKGYDGLIMMPGNPAKCDPLIRRIVASGTPVVCVASDAPRSGRLASVTADAEISGAIAAELFSRTLQKTGSVAIITGDLSTLDHAEKLKGFAAGLATMAPHLSLLPTIETHDQPRDAARATVSLLGQRPRPVGIYISTANSLPVLRALEERNALEQTQVIATDLFPELVSFLESGRILATLYQRPFTQGKAAFEALIRYLLDGVVPESATRFAPHIVLRSNLPLFADRAGTLQETNDSVSGFTAVRQSVMPAKGRDLRR